MLKSMPIFALFASVFVHGGKLITIFDFLIGVTRSQSDKGGSKKTDTD